MHALLSPSSAHRWALCPGSVPFTKDIPEERSVYAAEGTLAHALAADMLLGRDLTKATEDIKNAGYNAEDTRSYVEEYVRYVQALGGELLVEQRLNISDVTGEPEAYGTADTVIIKPRRIAIVDLKYGQGVRVSAVNNHQLLIYAAAAVRAFDMLGPFDEVELHIVQPRLNNISVETLSMADFLERVAAIQASACEAFDNLKLPPEKWQLNPSAQACEFCKARGTCRAYARFALGTAGVEPPEQGAPSLTAKELAESYGKLDAVEHWVNAIRREVLARLTDGQEVPGYKIVLGREGARKWTDDEAADKVLRRARLTADERYTKKVISPTAVEKLVKSGRIDEATNEKLVALVTRSPGKPTVVPLDDKRPAYTAMKPTDYPTETI